MKSARDFVISTDWNMFRYCDDGLHYNLRQTEQSNIGIVVSDQTSGLSSPHPVSNREADASVLINGIIVPSANFIISLFSPLSRLLIIVII